MSLKSRGRRLKKNKKITFWKFETCETEMVLLAGRLVMEIRAELVQTRLSWVQYIEATHLMSNLLLHVNVGCYLRGNSDGEMNLSWGSDACVQSDYIMCDLLEIVSNSESIYVVFSTKVYHSPNNSGLDNCCSICCLSIKVRITFYLHKIDWKQFK